MGQEHDNTDEKDELFVNDNFVQLYRHRMSDIRKLTHDYPIAVECLLYICEKMDKNNILVCSHKVLAEACDRSISSITKAIGILKDRGFIRILKTGSLNAYLINNDIAWTSVGGKKKQFMRAVFYGTVILSDTNNPEIVRSLRHAGVSFKSGIKFPDVDAIAASLGNGLIGDKAE